MDIGSLPGFLTGCGGAGAGAAGVVALQAPVRRRHQTAQPTETKERNGRMEAVLDAAEPAWPRPGSLLCRSLAVGGAGRQSCKKTRKGMTERAAALDAREPARPRPGWLRSRCLSGGGAGRRSPRLAVGPVSMLGCRAEASGARCCRTSVAILERRKSMQDYVLLISLIWVTFPKAAAPAPQRFK